MLITPALLLAAVTVCYVNALGNPFLFDDFNGIVNNQRIRQLWPLTALLSTATQTPLAGRPFTALSFALNYAVGELNPAGYHAVNALVVWATACLLYLLIRLTLQKSPSIPESLRSWADRAGAICALLWAVHPLLTEVVDYSVQRTESLAGLLTLLTLYAAARVSYAGQAASPAAASPREALWMTTAIVAMWLGMATKESMVVAPVLVLLYDIVFVTRSASTSLRRRSALYIALAASWFLLAALNLGGPRSQTAGFSAGVTPVQYLLHQGPVIAHYLRLAVWPHPLIIDYGVVETTTFGDALPGLLLVTALTLASMLAVFRWPAIGYVALWFFITLAPTSSLVPIASEVAAERRMYLPLMAVVVLVVTGIARWVARADGSNVSGKTALSVGGAVVAAALIAATVERNTAFADPVALWQGVVNVRPHARAIIQLGAALEARGRDDDALAQYQRAAALGRYEAHYALALQYESHQRPNDAIAEYRAFIATAGMDYRVPMVHVLLGDLLVKQGRRSEAEPLYRSVLTMQPNNAAGHKGLAALLFADRRYPESVVEYRAYLTLLPNDAAARTDAGRALVAAERPSEAVDEFAAAVRLAPQSSGAHQNLAFALASLERFPEAEQEFRTAISLAPQDATLYSGLAGLLASRGRSQEARELAERALRLDPNNPTVRSDLSSLLF